MRRFSFGSLRTRLILLVLLAVIPALGLTLYSGLKQRHHAISHAQEDALRMAENASGVQERLIENTRQIFFALSQMPEVQQINAGACSRIFSSLQNQSKGYTAFFATKPNGDIFASTLPTSGPITVADRTWYRQVVQTRKFVIGEYVIGRISGKATVTLAYPVLDRRGEMKAILGTGLDLSWLNQFMTEIKPPAGTTLNVTDRKGTILLRYPEPEKFIGKTMPEGSILKAILAKGEGVSEAIGLDGIPRLYGFTSLDRFAGSVYASVGIPKEIAFAEATRDMRRNLIWLGIVGALAIIAAWFGSSLFIMRPVDRLLRATKRLAEGDLMSRAGPRYDRGEIGELAFAFDQMANALAEKETQIREYTGELERKVQERTSALRESEERFRLAAESSTDLIYEWDIKERINWFGRIDELLGYAPVEFPRTLDAWANSVHQDDRDRCMDAVKNHLEKNEPYDIEYRIRRKDGVYRFWWARGTAVRDEKGNPYRWVGAVTDITERKRAEEEVRKLNEELEQRVIERTVQLEALNKELEAFSYSVSHDLRAPLRAIDGFSRIILEDYLDKLDDEGKRFLNTIRDNIQKMGQLIDDLLAFSRLGRQEMNLSDIGMTELAKGVFEELKCTLSGQAIQPNINSIPNAYGDRAMIRQVFINLFSNAIKFTRPKGNGFIEVGGFSDRNENIYYVKDNGVGFDMQYVGKLFGVFQRLHSTEEFEGTGVGLAIVQRIIHRHGGRVWAEGKVGEGATFYFTLPRGTKDDA